MKKVLSTVMMAVAALSFAERPVVATAEQEVHLLDHLIPAATMVHPAERQASLVITERMDLVACDFWYRLGRGALDYSHDYPAVASGGEITVTMKRVRGRKKKKIGSQVVPVTVLPGTGGYPPSGRFVAVGWADSPVICDWCAATYDFTFATSKKFPLRVKPGDVLLWTVVFSGMPGIEIDREGDPGYVDGLTFRAKCSTCGTIDHPCALPRW